MKKTQQWYLNLSAVATWNMLLLLFPLKAQAEWYVIGHSSDNHPIYLDNESVFIEGEVRSAKVNHKNFGRGLFRANCRTYEYYLQSNYGREEDYAAPGTIAGVIADEICTKFNPVNY